MTLGFIGVGVIAAAMVEGLGGGDIVLSPRGAVLAADLARRFARVRVADSNQAVVDAASTVVLAIRPQIAEEVVRSLRFRPDQRVISLVAATPIDKLRDWMGHDLPISRAVPLPFVADRACVTPVFPPDPETEALFNRLGTAIACETLHEFDLLAVGSTMMGSYFGILDTVQGWLVAQGLPAPAARAYMAGLFANLGQVAARSPADFATLRAEHSTKGGLNEQVFQTFVAQGGPAALTAALDGVLTRIQGR